MRIKANKLKDIRNLQTTAEKELAIEEKLDELIALLSAYEFDSETIKQFQDRFNRALESSKPHPEVIDAFKVIDQKDKASRSDLLDEFSSLLLSNKIDSTISRNYLKGKRINSGILMFIGVILITLGFAMIIMPAPPYFEMFTIFYFTRDDGVTLMDLISLIIIFSGIYVLIRSLYYKNGQ